MLVGGSLEISVEQQHAQQRRCHTQYALVGGDRICGLASNVTNTKGHTQHAVFVVGIVYLYLFTFWKSVERFARPQTPHRSRNRSGISPACVCVCTCVCVWRRKSAAQQHNTFLANHHHLLRHRGAYSMRSLCGLHQHHHPVLGVEDSFDFSLRIFPWHCVRI